MPVAPRIVNDVAYVMRINHEIHVAWQAQYLVRSGLVRFLTAGTPKCFQTPKKFRSAVSPKKSCLRLIVFFLKGQHVLIGENI